MVTRQDAARLEHALRRAASVAVMTSMNASLRHAARSHAIGWRYHRAGRVTALLLALASVASAEGSAQLSEEPLLTDEASGQTLLAVDVLPGDGFLNIAARAGGSPFDVRVTTPGGVATTYTLSIGNGLLTPPSLPASIDTPLRIDVSSEPGTYQVQFLEAVIETFDISISDNDTDPIDPTAIPSAGGRLHTSRWHIGGELPNVAGLVVNHTFFARVPTGSAAETLYRLDFGGIAGGDLCVVGNESGLPGALGRTSQPLSIVQAELGTNDASLDYCNDLEQFELYLNPPNNPLPQPAALTVTLAPLSSCGPVFTGSGETFEFSSDLPGTYEIIIDVDGNGFDPTSGSLDAVLKGSVDVGNNSVVWDGRDATGNVVAASTTAYPAQLSVRSGEFHAPAIDVEATDPGVTLSEVSPTDSSESPATMFWDDTAVIEDHTNNVPDPVTTLPAGVASNSSSHDWGDATTADDGVGNDAFIDTWVIGAETLQTLQFVIVDAAADADADGLDNQRECTIGSSFDNDDSDGDGLHDGVEASASDPLPDSDGDTVPDVLDDDDDGDGVLTVDEAPDDDDNGLPDDARDSDGDGTPDYLDPDDDDDGVLTLNEALDDTDEDGIVNALDPDDDGDSLPTLAEDLNQDGIYDEDTDGDTIPNYLDADDDGDSIPTLLEITQAGATTDLDGDMVPNWLDTDSDGDGISDAAEAAGDGDANSDGVPDYLDPINAPADSDDDGIPDEIECDDVADCQDTDDDGSPDHLDDDDDGDGLLTADERPNSTDVDTDDDGIPDHLDDDDDGDGIPTLFERPDGEDVDSDGDGTPDYLDDDDDDDGVSTQRERPGGEDLDTDDDGTPDYLDTDNDGDGVMTRDERLDGADLDTDDDGIPDYLDGDDDSDGVVTLRELNDGEALDTDQDGIPNHRDGDDDGDGIPTLFERPDGEDVDSDGDSIPDYLDDDDDGDGLATALEDPVSRADSDADGIPDYLDDDDDNDGIPTREERPDGQSTDTDRDGIPDYLDPSNDVVPDGGAPLPTTDPMEGSPPGTGTGDAAAPNPEVADAGRVVLVPTFRDGGADLVPDDGIDVPGELRGGGLSCGIEAPRRSKLPGAWLALSLGLVVLRRRKRCASLLAGLISFAALFGSVRNARAQQTASGFALNRYEAAPRGSDWLAADSLSFEGHLTLALGGVWEASLNPLVAYDDDGTELGSVVESQIYTHASGNIALWNLLRLGVTIPTRWFSNGTAQTLNGLEYHAKQGLALGDIRLAADTRLLGEASGPFRVGAGLVGFLPTGSQASYAGDGAFRAMPRVSVAGDVEEFAYAAQLGSMYRASDDTFDGREPGWEATFVGAAGYRFFDRQLLLGAEAWSATALSGKGTLRSRTPVEVALSANYTEGQWRLGAGFGPGIGTAPGTPQFRFIATLSWLIEAVEQGPPPEDGDGDGILDRDDACADDPGPSHVDPARNGCPRPAREANAD